MVKSKRILSVSELTSYLKDLTERDTRLSNLWLRGEVSNLGRSTSGHIYFTLKDKDNIISCVIFKNDIINSAFDIANGMQIVARGNLGIYGKSSRYQLYVKESYHHGIGSLNFKYQKLKDELSREGLFDEKHKKRLPFFPKKIGVIASEKSSVLRDIIIILKNKCPGIKLYIKSVSVQGEESISDIPQAIKYFNYYHSPDIIILARGGGSVEELYSFNSEDVAREIFCSQIPIVSAIGHETDYTIADFVSDYRAPTPSAAANVVVPDIKNLSIQVENITRSLSNSIKIYFDKKDSDIYNIKKKIIGELLSLIRNKENNIKSSTVKLNALSPLQVLERGYSISYNENNKIIKDYREISKGDNISILLNKGKLNCTVNKSEDYKNE